MRSPTSCLDTPYLSQLLEVTVQPIFILGDHRTGTTLLYKLLTLTGQFNYLSAYHVIRYDEILYNAVHQREAAARTALAEELQALAIRDRTIDTTPTNPDLPEEYGFILQRFSGEPYLTLETKAIFTELCQKVQLSGDAQKPLLLKNPWDFRQFMEVYRAFPDARFIFIHRHPLYSLSSKLQALRVLLAAKNSYMALLLPWYARFFESRFQQWFYRLIYSQTLGLDFSQLARQSVKTNTYFVEQISHLPPEQYCSIRYEDLCAHPTATMERVLSFLNIQNGSAPSYEALVQPRHQPLLPEVARRQAALCRTLEAYITYHQYPMLKDVI